MASDDDLSPSESDWDTPAGVPRTNRQAKIVAWVLILTFVLPIVLGLLASALGWV